jgi:hypothetical protein
LVIYVLGEGVSRFPLRMKAWCAEHDTTPAALIRKKSFVLVPRALNLLDAEAVQTFLADVVAPAVQKAGKQVSMIVFDTWSRCVAGAENDEAFNLAVGHIDEIRRVTNATVVALHHTPKDGRATARGSGVLEGAIDAQVWSVATPAHMNLSVRWGSPAISLPNSSPTRCSRNGAFSSMTRWTRIAVNPKSPP